MDDASMRDAKREIRRAVRARLGAMSPDARARAGEAACRVVGEAPQFRDARAILLYLSLPDEVDTHPLLVAALGAGKRVFLPRVDWDRDAMEAVEVFSPEFPTEMRRHDLLEPVGTSVIEPRDLGLVVVPGVAFDRAGGRVGRGKGFYDRFLAQAGRHTPGARGGPFRLALCFACQIVDRVPRDAHDEAVDAIASESGLVAC